MTRFQVYVQGYIEIDKPHGHNIHILFFNCKYLFRYTWRALKAVTFMV